MMSSEISTGITSRNTTQENRKVFPSSETIIRTKASDKLTRRIPADHLSSHSEIKQFVPSELDDELRRLIEDEQEELLDDLRDEFDIIEVDDDDDGL
jgi:hypothetical protein